MKHLTLLLLTILLAGSARAQTPPVSALSCGTLKAESTRTGAASRWTISGPSGNTTETGTLRSGPRFECVGGAVLIVEFTSTAGSSIFNAYFPDGTDISYGRQQIDHRGNRFVLPIQSKARMPASFRAAFDYHCKLDMPADPISPAMRADCLF